MIENRQYTISNAELEKSEPLLSGIERALGPSAFRWYVSQVTKEQIVVEATLNDEDHLRGDRPVEYERRHYPGKSVLLSVIPTGIGCSIGGYAGDASGVTNLLASTVDYLLTHPNALNASDFIGLASENIVYADGYCIDQFSKGLADLHLPSSNRVGLIIEKADSRKLELIFNIVNTVRAVHGVSITDYVITDQPIGGRCVENGSGAFSGSVDNLDVLLRSAEKLIGNGVNAIAVTSDIQDLPLDNYAKHFQGQYPNPVGGVEAVISYSVSRKFQVPCAHAPLLNVKQLDLSTDVVDARGAGEMSSASGLACILIGLRRAPQVKPGYNTRTMDIINMHNLLAVVSPASSVGGIPMICSQKYGIPLVVVTGNETVFDVTAEKLGFKNVIEVRNYAEAAGIVLALKRGISPEAISRPLRTLRP